MKLSIKNIHLNIYNNSVLFTFLLPKKLSICKRTITKSFNLPFNTMNFN